MSKVWVVQETSVFFGNEGNENEVVGIFSSEEKAKAFLPQDFSHIWIESWDLDELSDKKYAKQWDAYINMITGELIDCHAIKRHNIVPKNSLGRVKFPSDGFVPCDLLAVSYVSQDHANELAVKAREEYMKTKPEEYMKIISKTQPEKMVYIVEEPNEKTN